MKLSVKLLVLGAIFSTLLSACSANSGTSRLEIEAAGEDGVLVELPEEVLEVIAREEDAAQFPVMDSLDLSPAVVNPGGLVTLTTPANLNGKVTITHGSYSRSLELSSGSFEAPGDAPDGLYSLLLNDETGTIGYGSFRIASAPGIWISTSGKYVSDDAYVEIRVSTHPSPPEMLAIFRLGDLAQDTSSEEDYSAAYEDFDPFAFDGPSAYLLPDSDGVLQLASFPGVPLAEIADQTFLLPGRLANQLQVYALDPELAQLMSEGVFAEDDTYEEDFRVDGLELASNILSIQRCNTESEIRGELGGPGIIRAISLDGEGVTRTSISPDGSFSLQIPPGRTFIEGWLETDQGMTVLQGQTVDVPCGESVQVSFAARSSPHLASLNSGIAGSEPAAQGRIGNKECQSIYVIAPNQQPDGFIHAPGIAMTLAAQLEAGLSRASIATYLDVLVLLERAAREQEQGFGTGQEELNRVADITNADILVYFNIYQVEGTHYSTIAALDVSSASRITEAILTGETAQELGNLPASFINKIQKAAVCASVEPAESVIGPNETVGLTIEMTDLNGEAHEEVKVSLESGQLFCGSLEWTEKTINGTSVGNTYTADDKLSCQDRLVFVGEAEGPQGKIQSNFKHAVARILKPLAFHFNMQMVFYGEDGGTIDFNWDADFYADEDNVVKTVLQPEGPGKAAGGFTSQAIHCEVHENGVLTFRSEDLKPNATWDLELGGNLEIFENGFVEVRLVPVGTSWNFDMQPFPEECTLLIENLFISFMRILSLQPANFAPGGAIELGGIADQPIKMNIPLEGSSGFNVTISRAPTLSKQP